MGVVHQRPGIVAFAQGEDVRQRGEIAIHRKHAIGEDHGAARSGPMGGQQAAQMVDVVMPEGFDPRPRQARAGMQAGMGQAVDQDQVVRAGERRGDGEIGQIARAEHDAVLGALELGQAAFEPEEQGVAAGDEARGAGARAPFGNGVPCGGDDGGMVRQAEIVVGTGIDQCAAVALDADGVAMPGFHCPAPEGLAIQLGKLVGGEALERGGCGCHIKPCRLELRPAKARLSCPTH